MPASPQAGSPVDAGIVRAVRAYVHALRLNERDLPAGLSIPFGSPVSGGTDHDYRGGTATATGATGTRGHQIYEVAELQCRSEFAKVGVTCFSQHRFMEIAPEPDATPPPRAGTAL